MDKSQHPARGLVWLYIALNLGLLPGMGTLLARRWVSGLAQFALSGSGVTVFLWAAFRIIVFYYRLAGTAEAPPFEPSREVIKMVTGLALFGVAWIWALFSSVKMMRGSRLKSETEISKLSL